MYRGAIFSALLHIAVFLIAVIGLPHFAHELPMMDYPVPVDIVTIAEITNAPSPPPEPEKKEEVKKEEPKPEPPKPEEAKPPPPEPEAAEPEPPPGLPAIR